MINNIWAIFTSIGLFAINAIVGFFGNIAVLSGSGNPFWWNVTHIFLWTAITYSVGYGISGVTLGCILGILINLFILIARLKNEYFEWR